MNTKMKNYFTLTGLEKKKKYSGNTKYWQGYGVIGNFIHPWSEYKLIKPLWKIFWHYLIKSSIRLYSFTPWHAFETLLKTRKSSSMILAHYLWYQETESFPKGIHNKMGEIKGGPGYSQRGILVSSENEWMNSHKLNQHRRILKTQRGIQKTVT